MSLEKTLLIISLAGSILVLISMYRSIFFVSMKRVLITIGITLLLWVWILYLNTYSLYILIWVFSFLWIIVWIWKRNYRIILFLLTIALVWTFLADNYISYLWIIPSIIVTVCLEELAKASGVSIQSNDRLPYDWVLSALLIGSFFGLFEAWLAWRIQTLSHFRMRISTSMWIHTIVSATLIGVWIYYTQNKSHRIRITILWMCIAISIHSWYNILQWSSVSIIIFSIVSYLWISYRASKIDRLLLF